MALAGTAGCSNLRNALPGVAPTGVGAFLHGREPPGRLGNLAGVSGRGRGSGAEVCAFSLVAEEAQDFDGASVGVAEPVGGAGVEFGGFAGAHDQVVVAQDQAQPTVEDVDPFVAWLRSSFATAFVDEFEQHLAIFEALAVQQF